MKEEKEEILEYLFRKKGEASTEEIKKEFNFINLDEILNSLINENKIIIENGKILLTEKGSIEGEDIKNKHEFVEDFLKNIGVPENFAHEKACEIEHHIKEDKYKSLIPLSEVKEGEEVEVVLIRGGRGFVQRLCDLGLTPNTKIKILRKAPFGPIEISVRGYNLALGRGVVSKIWVRKKSS
ncbi:MAG: metal-dependent transcriptional regulator [Caldisericia bacterium]|jgi:ferrous iron transport protein A|nr:metal-dependent transcriptional regulator [Caldisericia bacterium]